MSKISLVIASAIVALLLGVGIWGGWSLHKSLRPCPIITSDTVTIVDTNTYTISDSLQAVLDNLQKEVDYWKGHRDTLKLPGDSIPYPADIDTAAILKDYYTKYKYGWIKQDSNIYISDSVYVTQNVPFYHKIDYKMKRPFVTIENNIDNTITYSKYLQVGLSMPVYSYDTTKVNLQNLTLEASYIFPKGYVGVGWQPNTQSIMARAGVTLFKFRTKK